MRTIAIVNQKGGVAKTTTACTLAMDLSKRGYRVLVVDMDAQCNTSSIMRADTDGTTIRGVLMREISAEFAVQHAEIDIIPSSPNITQFESMPRELGQEYRLKEGLARLDDKYDFVVIDTPPSLGLLMYNTISAANYLVIPCYADSFSFNGITQLLKTISTALVYSNADLKIAGVLFTRHNDRTKASKGMCKMFERAAEEANLYIFKTYIRDTVLVKEAQTMCQSVIEYAPDSDVCKDCKAFTDELLERISIMENKNG